VIERGGVRVVIDWLRFGVWLASGGAIVPDGVLLLSLRRGDEVC
jgi:hypothetical protein